MSLVAAGAAVLPPAPALACGDVAPYCDPVDGTIHDGSGTGTLPQVPADPSPTAPGIWLGNTVSAGYCYADQNRFAYDADRDWLDDTCEFTLARAFSPVLLMHPQDGCPEGEPYWAAKYFKNGSARFVRIAYLLSYYRDCGQGGWGGIGGGHAGDSEFIMIGVGFNQATRHWELREAYLSAHAGTPSDSSQFVTDPADLEYPARYLAYPRVWVVRAKHANYRSQDECGDGAFGFDECRGGHTAVGRIRVYRHRNVGSRHVDLFPNGVMAENPALRDVWRTEYFYTSRSFRGWQPNFPDGVTPYATFLRGSPFDCARVSLECHWGQGPTPPTAYELSGVVDGPQRVTAYEAASWSTFVTGGQLPYQGTWWRQYASDTAPVLVTGTTGSTFSAGTLTFTPDRCESFTLTMRVTDSSGQSFTDTHPVAVTCPQPPLSVYIDGPALIAAKGTYTFTAVTSGGVNSPAYSWSERFCDDQAGTSCSDWVGTEGLGDTYTRTLNKDCSGTGEKTFWLRVVVTGNNQTAESERWSSLCAPA